MEIADLSKSLNEAVVLFQDGAEALVRESDDAMILDAGHRLGRNHGVDDRLLGGLHGRGKEGLDAIVRQHRQLHEAVRSGRAGIGRRKGDENVAGTVAGDAAIAAEAKRDAPSQPLELVGNERRIGSHDDNDRAAIRLAKRRRSVSAFFRYLFANRNAGDAQVSPRSVITLHEYADGVSTVFVAQLARRRSYASFELVADHSRAAAD